MRYLATILIISGALVSFGQKEKSKRDQTINTIIGKWIYSDGYIKGDKAVKFDSNPLLDSISFNSDMTFSYSYESRELGKLRVTGIWEIDSKGTVIKFMNRVAKPSVPGTALDFNRKFKLIGLTKLRMEEEIEIAPHPNPHEQVGKVGQETMVLNYTRTK
jgi:hypothetical protein